MNPFCIDANAINVFQQERLRDEAGSGHAAINLILAVSCIALDEDGLCRQEWISCAGGKFPFALQDWIDNQLVSGGIRLFRLAETKTCRKSLIAIGLPGSDHKWVRLAIGAKSNVLVTEDIDFFDPKCKKASRAKREEVMEMRDGRCARHLKDAYGLLVMCLRHVCVDFKVE